jgi:conjugative transfer signal peptidase TraF
MVDRAGRVDRLRLPAWGAAAIVPLLAGLAATIVWTPRPLLVWNASASAPIGAYTITSPKGAATGDIVIARVPSAWRRLAAERYIPAAVPLVKRVAASRGDTVCAIGRKIFINGRLGAERRREDGLGRVLPRWTGCITLGSESVLLLMDNPDSFDGRYFGPTRREDIIGKARHICAG